MHTLDFAANSLVVNLLLFGMGMVVIWYAGSKLERHADTIASHYGLGKAFAGLVLLAGATSLPEIATTVTAALNNNGPLAVNNLMGGVAMQTAILALADWTLARGRLTFFTPDFALLMQGVSLILLLAVGLLAITAGELFTISAIGGWSSFLMILYLFLLYQNYKLKGTPGWHPDDMHHENSVGERGPSQNFDPATEEAKGNDTPYASDAKDEKKQKRRPVRTALALFGSFSFVVLAAGWLVVEVADTLTDQMQLSAGFVGAVFVAVSTSMPEISTTTAAVRNGNYSTAMSNILGTNMIEVALLFVADAFYRNGSILATGGSQAVFMAALGIVMTGIYLWGLLERRDKRVWRIGVDSAIVLLVYVGGIAILYSLD